MMTKIKTIMRKLVLAEYTLAAEQYGARHNTPHEAYAVMKEEYDEAYHEMLFLDEALNQEYWRGVMYDSDLTCQVKAREIYEHAVRGACELVQVAAMAHKTLQGYEKG